MIINEERKRRILDEIIKNENFKTEIEEGEFTKAELKREYGLSRSQIDRLIDELLSAKKITSRPALDKGKPCIAYSFVDGSEFDFNL